MITRGHQQALTLDPGSFSTDLDGNVFNASVSTPILGREFATACIPYVSQDWKYEYYCRIYGVWNFPNILGSLLPIDDPRVDLLNPSCFSTQSSKRHLLLYCIL